jgi:hypothetical protein
MNQSEAEIGSNLESLEGPSRTDTIATMSDAFNGLLGAV